MTLEEHLEAFEQTGLDIYKRLHAVWKSNQQRCTDLLKGVDIHYPYFSLHDASHSEKVVSNIERLLGKRVKKLSATDTWLILHAAYMHDLGMIIPDEEYRNVWNDAAFQEYLKRQQDSPMADIREASNFLRNLPKGAPEEKDPPQVEEKNLPQNWPVEVYFSSSLLISDYFRRNHAERIRPYLEDGEQNQGISFANINNKRVVELLGNIASLHTNDFSEVMKLERTSVGLGGSDDDAHPRFVAELLRLGDALDLDAGRFPYDLKYLRGNLPESSDVHRRLHLAVKKFSISPKEVAYRADCKDYETYHQIKQLTGYMAEEFKDFAYHWDEIVPDGFPLPQPRFNFSEQDILYKGKPDTDKRAGLRFTLMESKAFQLLEGANIYDSDMAAVRELLQNALDASKIQLWRDLRQYRYKRQLPPGVSPRDLQPYHIPAEIFKDYGIEITVTSISEEKAELKFTDHGTGFSMDSIRQMCQVAKSYSARTEELEQMPPWLRPTGGFGIGLQSAFLMAPKITIDTSAEEDGSKHYLLEIEAPRNGGRVRLSELPSPREDGRGSAVSLEISGKPESFIAPASFQKTTFPSSKRLYEWVTYFCRRDCGKMLFPVRVVWGDLPDVSYDVKKADFSFLASEGKDSEQYRYRFDNNAARICLWDKKDSIMFYAGFKPAFNLGRAVFFKGMRISGKLPEKRRNELYYGMRLKDSDLFAGLTGEYLSFRMDVHGMSADGTLELNRSSFTKQGGKDVRSKLANAMDFYMKVLTNEIKSALLRNDTESPLLIVKKQTPYGEMEANCRLAYWFSTTPEMRQEIARKHIWWLEQSKPGDIGVKEDSDNFHYLQLLPEHGCETRRMSVQEYAQNYMSLPYMQYEYKPRLNQQYERLLRSAGFNQILLSYPVELPEIDERFHSVYAFPYKDENGDDDYESIAAPDENPRSEGCHTDEKTRELMFQRTFEELDSHGNVSWYSLPPLEEYQALWVDKTDVEIHVNESWPCKLFTELMIIFPLPDGENSSHIRDAVTQSPPRFLDALAVSERFLSLVRFVTEKAKHPTDTETVKAAYLRLAEEIWKAVNIGRNEKEEKHE